MPEFHSEPYLYVAEVTHRSALIAWGAFYFRVRKSDGRVKLVDDGDLRHVHPPRHETIGARSDPYGEARVEVFDSSGSLVATAVTADSNHCWVAELEPDTEYSYKVFVNGEEWGEGERLDWHAGEGSGSLVRARRYVCRFRTFPDPTRPLQKPLTFAVIGDFGTGVKKPSSSGRRQREVAAALEQAVTELNARFILTTGDNIYAGKRFLGLAVGDEGDEDDDWFFTFFQPYRYIVNRIPVYPSIGNHDAAESESRDDRAQLIDNLYLKERLAPAEAAGRASLGPGLFYRFRFGSDIEFLCIDSSKEPALFPKDRLFEHPKHRDFLQSTLAPSADAPRWRIPFTHHPPFSAGPRHKNTKEMAKLLPLLKAGGVRVMFSGHEHNFQHSREAGIDYFVTGAAGKLRDGVPSRQDFERARTQTWSPTYHFLMVTIDGKTMTVRAIGEIGSDGRLADLSRRDPAGNRTTGPIVVALD